MKKKDYKVLIVLKYLIVQLLDVQHIEKSLQTTNVS